MVSSESFTDNSNSTLKYIDNNNRYEIFKYLQEYESHSSGYYNSEEINKYN